MGVIRPIALLFLHLIILRSPHKPIILIHRILGFDGGPAIVRAVLITPGIRPSPHYQPSLRPIRHILIEEHVLITLQPHLILRNQLIHWQNITEPLLWAWGTLLPQTRTIYGILPAVIGNGDLGTVIILTYGSDEVLV